MRQVTTEELSGPARAVDAEVLEFRSQFGQTSPLDELVRHGAQQMLQTAIEAEVDEFLTVHAERRDARGNRLVVRNGYQPAREILTGAGRLAVARTVTLPLVVPALASGFILSVLQALALFGSPAILALPAEFHTITTQVWSFFHFPPKTEMAAAFSIPLLLATALLLLVQKRLLGRRGYAAVGGKGDRRRPVALG